MRQGRGSEATEAVFAFRQKSLFIAGRTSIGCQKEKEKTFFCTRDVYLFICVIQQDSGNCKKLYCKHDQRIADRPTAGIEALPHYHQLLVMIYD